MVGVGEEQQRHKQGVHGSGGCGGSNSEGAATDSKRSGGSGGSSSGGDSSVARHGTAGSWLSTGTAWQ
ncbi:hypothetical protein NL676_011683 [Syzygium grande]|nr:hypothetical protein NL676_011683 [Syzygium grande]